jgi:hypothetical protein
VAGQDEPLASAEQRRIARLLEVAAAHVAVGRLTEPPGANAYEAYTLVLEIDPDNEAAKQGLGRLEQLAAENSN